MRHSPKRFIAGAGATTAVALAGCSSIPGPSNSPGDAVSSLYEAINNADGAGVEETLHNQSPADASGVTGPATEQAELSVQSASVSTDGPSESAIRDAVGGSRGDEELQQIIDAATSANKSAVVEADIEFSGGDQSTTSTQSFVVATEDGVYQVLG